MSAAIVSAMGKKVSAIVAVLIAGGALLVGIFIGVGIGRLGTEAVAQPSTQQLGPLQGDGTYIVGDDVEPGTYKSEGGANCYWARLGSDGKQIIANNRGSGPAVLVIQAGDGQVQVSGCAPFVKAS